MSYTLLGPCDFRAATVPALIHVFPTPVALTLEPRSAGVAKEGQGCPSALRTEAILTALLDTGYSQSLFSWGGLHLPGLNPFRSN